MELKQNGSPEPEFDMDEERTYLNAIIRIRDGFERKEKMSESMSELERARMQIILIYLETNKEINSAATAKLLEVEIKTASCLLLKAEKLRTDEVIFLGVVAVTVAAGIVDSSL